MGLPALQKFVNKIMESSWKWPAFQPMYLVLSPVNFGSLAMAATGDHQSICGAKQMNGREQTYSTHQKRHETNKIIFKHIQLIKKNIKQTIVLIYFDSEKRKDTAYFNRNNKIIKKKKT